ncbi:MAG TPA: RHS repeat-associated core domain-containing protein [Ktedonobacterales bacterium]
MLARYTYDSGGVPTSVQVGSDPATAPRDYYVYNGHGDVVALTDASGTPVAAYGDDAWGAVTVDTEHFANGWRNPYFYDGHDGARYDVETGLYWLSVRAYDPTLGRFLSHDPLGRAPLFFADQPYAYAGNHPLVNVDPSGQRMTTSDDAGVRVESTAGVQASRRHAQRQARVYYSHPVGNSGCRARCLGRGQLAIAAIVFAMSNLGALVADAIDLAIQAVRVMPIIGELLAEDWLAAPSLINVLLHVARDVTDVVNTGLNFLALLGVKSGVFDSARTILFWVGAALDVVTPLADVVSNLSILEWFGNPFGALSNDVEDALYPYLMAFLKSKATSKQILGWLLKAVFKDAWPWLVNGSANLISLMTPEQFCSMPGAWTWCRS